MGADVELGLFDDGLALLADEVEGDALLDELLEVAITATVLQPGGVESLGTDQVGGGGGEVALGAVRVGIVAGQVNEVGHIVGVLGVGTAEGDVELAELFGTVDLLPHHGGAEQHGGHEYQQSLHAGRGMAVRKSGCPGWTQTPWPSEDRWPWWFRDGTRRWCSGL